MSKDKKNKSHQSSKSNSAVTTASIVTRTAQANVPPAQKAPPAKNTEPTDCSLPASATLQQQRAAFALTRIKALAVEWANDAKKQKEFNKEFNSYASSMPFMIHANGLGQTAAFYRRKGTDHTYYRLYQLLGDWLSQTHQPFAGQADLLNGITQSDMDAYLAAQAEALLLLDWVKKLASAFLAEEEEANP